MFFCLSVFQNSSFNLIFTYLVWVTMVVDNRSNRSARLPPSNPFMNCIYSSENILGNVNYKKYSLVNEVL